MIWPNLDDTEAKARFILDDPTELYFCHGMWEMCPTTMNALNQVAELIGRDLFKFSEV
jgi:hypothetical protein